MFNIDADPEFTCPVKLSRPGFADPVEIQVTYKHKNRTQAAAWVLAAHKADQANDEPKLLALLKEVIAGWGGVVDKKGNDVPYSPTNLAKLILAYTPVRGELYQGYINELTVAKRKN
ncbi:MAG: hypothetical protein JWQ72_3835 [Polaromonas sp.]|nr:hypothetical protein [Polaromonas sp.]